MSRRRTAVLALFLAAASGVGPHAAAQAQALLEIRAVVAPPPLPVYVQPVIPADGYLWVPGYWDWDVDFGYFWVPGTWVLPPRPNLLWTPGYWGWDDGAYLFHRGYWDVEVGYYGGIDYGYGYAGTGYQGGYWEGPRFFYNRSVTNITNVSITNVYTKTVVVAAAASAVSFNGGAGGVSARPTPRQLVIAQQSHVQPTTAQVDQLRQARALPVLRAATNHGVPPIAATPRAAAFHSPEVTAAKPVRLPPPNAETAVPPKTGAPSAEKAGAAPAVPGTRDAATILKPDASRNPATHPAAVAPSPESRPLQNDAAHQQPVTAQPADAQRRLQQQTDEARRRQEEDQARQRTEAVQHQQQDAQRAAAQAEAQKRAQQQAASEAQRREQAAQQAEAQKRAQQEAASEAQRREQAAQQAEAQRRAQQQQAAAEAQRREQAQQAQQAAAAAAQQRAMAAERQQAEQQARARAAQQQAEQRQRPAEPQRQEPARHPECGRPGEPPCR